MSDAPLPCPACRGNLTRDNLAGKKDGYDLLRCHDCRSVTVRPYLSSAIYPNNNKPQAEEAQIRRLFAKHLLHGDSLRFLDIRCRSGYAVKTAMDLGWHAQGIDTDAEAIAAATARFGATPFTLSTVEDYAHAGQQVDTIYARDALACAPDVDALIGTLCALLSFRGRMLLTLPDAGHFRVPRRFQNWAAVRPAHHLHYFTKDGLWQLMRRHGFTIDGFSFSLTPHIQVIAQKRF